MGLASGFHPGQGSGSRDRAGGERGDGADLAARGYKGNVGEREARGEV